MSAPERQLTSRRVFYIPGFDPFPPRRYRELYRKEGAAQAALSGYDIALSKGSGTTGFGWHVQMTQDGQRIATDVEVLYWADIVKTSMSMGIARTYLVMAQTAWIYISTGALWRLMRLRKGPVIAALYPVGFLLVQALIAALLAWGAGAAVSYVLANWALSGWAGLACAGAVLWSVLEWFRRRDGKFFAYYLMHDYAYSARSKGANPPELEARLRDFAQRISAALDSDVDEVLVVGHSSGAHLGVSVISDVLRARGVKPGDPELSFLSLGQVVPMVSFLPKAGRLRADLAYLAAQRDVFWADVTAPGDGCAFALCDPVCVTGVAPPDKVAPLVFSAAFTQSLSPARWKALRWRFFRLHFQYLCAFDAPKDYDYFQITAGPLSLRRRYEDRPASKSRIETPVNRYNSLEP